MRKILCMLCGLTMTAALFAEIETASLENTLTSGVFDNEFDTQFTPNADFGSYGQHFIYGGLGNPGAGKAAGGEAEKDVDKTPGPLPSGLKAFGTKMFDKDNPMMFGYYMPGKLPMSFFASFGRTGDLPRHKGSTKTVWTDENRTKKLSVTKTGYYAKPLFDKSDFKFQYLIGIGTGWNLVTGLQFEYDSENNSTNTSAWASKYKKETRTHYTDPSLSYTKYMKGYESAPFTEVQDALSLLHNLRKGAAGVVSGSDVATTDKFSFRVPVAFSTGSLNHVAALKVGTELKNNGGAYYSKQDGKEISYKSSIVGLRNTLTAGYDIEIPAADRDGDSWSVGTSFTLGFNTKSNRWTYSYTKQGVSTFGKYAQTHKPSLDFAVKVEGSRMLKFASPKQAIRFNMKPTASFKVLAGLKKWDDDADKIKYYDGGYDPNVTAYGTVNGTKVTHSKITKGQRRENIVTAYTSTASVPMGLKILPENWKVGFLLGATPEVSYTVVTTSSYEDMKSPYKSKTETEKNTINGKDAGTGYTNKAKYPSDTAEVGNDREFHWNFKETHTIGLTIPFEGGAHLDVRVNGNALSIEGFAIQAFIPLGSGKAAAAAE